MSTARLLIKLPSRSRPGTLLHAVQQYAKLCADPLNTEVVVSVDEDDRTITETLLDRLSGLRVLVTVKEAPRTTKIGAMNRDIPRTGWDIIMATSDDMWPVEPAYDTIIRQDMDTHWPSGDGCLWYSDGRQDQVCTLSIMDRAYYDRFVYIYHPDYKSYRCDREFTDVALAAGRMVQLPTVLCRHEHPHWRGAVPDDALYCVNRTHKPHDHVVYDRRKAANFPPCPPMCSM